jgi:hypothetical protein
MVKCRNIAYLASYKDALIAPEDGKNILIDIHEGICVHHASSRALVAKALRAGFY